jgi:hypothetical protein
VERITSYVGGAACRECHPGESALYARSGHHRTLWPVEPGRHPVVAWLDGKKTKDPSLPGVTWSHQLRDGRLVVERAEGDRTDVLPLDYGFGSGTHGVTFIALPGGPHPEPDPSGLEYRLSYFTDGRQFGITPGQDRPEAHPDQRHAPAFGRSLAADQLQQCFACHSTLTSTLARNRLELATLIPNVSCERCHGPGRAHVAAARRGESELPMRMGYDRVEPSVELGLCGECHRLPRALSPAQIRPDNLGIVRFQPVGLSMSACYADGLSGLRCVSCHDPHDRVATEHSAYEAVCLSCHQAGSKQPACPVSPATKCIDCHMPRRQVGENGAFTDHWIRKPEPEGSAKPGGARRAAASARPASRGRLAASGPVAD